MRILLTSSVALASALVCGTGYAQEVSGNVTLTSNYIFRGVTQTGDGPAIQGGFDFANEGFYAGVWGSSVDFSDDTTMELDLYAGFTATAGGWDLDFGGIYYLYPDSPQNPSQDFVEVYGGASRDLGGVVFDVKLSYSPEFYLEVGNAFYLESGLATQIADNVSIDARIGASRFDDTPASDYEDYQIGATFATEAADFDFRFHDASNGDSSFVISISKSI